MLHRGGVPLIRLIRVLCLSLILSLVFPLAVSAAPARAITVKFDILSVQEGETVTIRTRDFPQRTQFKVLMGKATNRAIDGVEAATFDSEKGGVVEATFPIPEAVKEIRIIGIRIESENGYYTAYNWFFNRTQTSLVRDPGQPPTLDFSNIEKNQSATVKAEHLPPLTTFRVRVGPHYTFYRDYVSTTSVRTDETGTVEFPVELGENVQDMEFISVRMDGGGRYVFGTFSNVDGGAYVPPADLIRIVPCTLLAINPIPALDPREDFDAVWTVQNTGLSDWNSRRTIFKYLSGTKMHKRSDKVFLSYTVERGWTVDLAVDMLAPETPGWYSTTWGLVDRDNNLICDMRINVFVQE